MTDHETSAAERCRKRLAEARELVSDALRELSVPSVSWSEAHKAASRATAACFDVVGWCGAEMRRRDDEA